MKPYYKHAGMTIYHGDCREVLPGLPVAFCRACDCELADESILAIHLAAKHDVGPYCDLTLTDPPYGVGKAEWDAEIPDMGWLEIARARSEVVMFTPGNGSQYKYPAPDWTLCWFRPASCQRAAGGGFSWWEPVLVYGTNPMQYDASQFPANDFAGFESKLLSDPGHPCPKPLKFMRWLVGEGSNDKGILVDPFMGSGTTLRAAKDLGRRAIGIEINEQYCEISAKRLSQEVFQF